MIASNYLKNLRKTNHIAQNKETPCFKRTSFNYSHDRIVVVFAFLQFHAFITVEGIIPPPPPPKR